MLPERPREPVGSGRSAHPSRGLPRTGPLTGPYNPGSRHPGDGADHRHAPTGARRM